MALTDADEARLRCVVREAVSEELDLRRTIPIEEHRDHHNYISDLIDRRKVRGERWEAVRRQVIGWAVIVVLLGIGAASYEWLAGWVRRIVGNGG